MVTEYNQGEISQKELKETSSKLLSCFRGVFQNWNSGSISRKKPSHETSAKSQYKCKKTLTAVQVVDQSLTGLGKNTTGLTNCRILKIWITIPLLLSIPATILWSNWFYNCLLGDLVSEWHRGCRVWKAKPVW